MQVVLPFVLITFGEQHISSALTGILVSAAPIFTALIAARFDDDERPHGIATAGVVMGMVGVVLLFGFDLTGDAQALAGGLMVLLAAAGYAVGSLYLKHRVRGVAPVGVAAATMVAGTLVLLPFALFTLPAQTPDLQTIGAMVALGAGGTGIAFAIYFTLIAEIGPGRASLVAYIAPGLRRLLRRDAARRAADAGRDPRPRPDPGRLVGGGGGPLAGTVAGDARVAARAAAAGARARLAPGRGINHLPEADLAVRARPRLRALDEVQPLRSRP